MTNSNSEILKLAIVKWHDAHQDGDSWTAPEDIDPNPAVVVSLGFMLDEVKPGHTTLAQSHVHGHYGPLLHVPSAMVREITILTTIDLDKIEG